MASWAAAPCQERMPGRPDRNVRVWFGGSKVSAIYMTRSDYGEDDPGPFDPEFARLLPERLAQLNIDSAGLQEVRAIFGEPSRYIWGNQTFKADALPDRFIVVYPSGFRVWFSDDEVIAIYMTRSDFPAGH